ncbi:hypothetical protein JCM16418_2203 [Paenibacillus pini JCM 16418]|uniref:Uncharacterized protein n=1 Tax=Paenibacillus pini JCM 16418 TaxID=1236976 RepID=W7YKE9_9BACL|nr:hypothetical protein JCM16418_2203 [Paenibacillus pini JCM 16418]
MIDAKSTGHKACARWHARRRYGITAIEPHSFRCNSVQIRCCLPVITIAAHMIRAERVNIQIDHSHAYQILCSKILFKLLSLICIRFH